MDLAIFLDRASDIPLYRQLAEELRLAVLEGRLKSGQKLPSSRNLAKLLDISRFTVIQSYEQLKSEGYFLSSSGSGTYVCSEIPEEWLESKQIETQITQVNNFAEFSQFGQKLIPLKQLEIPEPKNKISFRFGSPALDQFPIQQWRKFLYYHCENSPECLDYIHDAAGYFPLRVAIADYLKRSRAVRCNPEQVIIVNGSQQALNLITRLVLEPGDWVAMEDPGYLGARHCFTGQSANLEPIPINAEGLNVNYLTQCDRRLKLVYVTPSHQFPTGVTLSLQQRIALLQWAQTTETLIIEDDYDSEYRYESQPIPALQGMDRSESVIYIGTFSKTMFPSLRIGYLVVPNSWISLVRSAKWLCDRSTPLLEQYVLTDWITQGHFERHIRKMRQLYNLRRQALIAAFQKYFGDRVTILGANAGIHVMVKIETHIPDSIIIQKAAGIGVGLISAREYYLNPQFQGEFIFGYAQLEEAEIEQGILKLSQILKD